MKRILILKTGTTFFDIRNSLGDFDEMIMNALDLSKDAFIVVDVQKQKLPKELNNIKGIIITGSHSMVSENEPWSIELGKWLQSIIYLDIPILGICYGHQLLAQVFGGKVGFHPKGIEIGTVAIQLTEQGKRDFLFSCLPSTFWGHTNHSQTILTLPKNAVVLAHNDFEKVHAFRIADKKIWGVQFHPEFIKYIMTQYIEIQKYDLKRQNLDYHSLLKSVRSHTFGLQLFNQFKQLMQE